MAVVCCSLVDVTGEAIAQTSSASSTGQIAFDRPEAWAMKYFTSATALSGLSMPESPNARFIGHRFTPHAAAGANLVDNIFQTNARTYGQPDHTRLQAKGVTLIASAGIGYTVTERLAIAADLFYAPLTVRRTMSSASSFDPMINARALISYRVIR